MNDVELTEVVRTSASPFARDMVSARFIPSVGLTCLWNSFKDKNGREGIVFSFPDYLSDAPYVVIRDMTRGMIQQICYSSKHDYCQETKKWLIMGMNKPEKIHRYCSRNNYTELELYQDAIIVEYNGDVVISSPIFRTIAVPKSMADAPDRMHVIESEYKSMNDRIETYMEV